MERPIKRQTAATSQGRTLDRAGLPGQVVLVLQGGGALGSYQAGVYQAMQEAGIEPDWIVGTSIGAINASLIAGNAPQNRLARLIEFWSRVRRAPQLDFHGALPGIAEKWSYWTTLTQGIPGFFMPNPLAHAGDFYPLGADRAGYYSTAPLQATLAELIDFDLINKGNPRLTIGAAHVRTSQMTYFDSRQCKLDVKHIMASGALPPAFPAVRVDGELYWDGGILSNTPTEVVAGRRSSQGLAYLHRPSLESSWRRAGHDGGSPQSPQGRPIFEPDRKPDHATPASAPVTPRHQ
jgi:NTE family protein